MPPATTVVSPDCWACRYSTWSVLLSFQASVMAWPSDWRGIRKKSRQLRPGGSARLTVPLGIQASACGSGASAAARCAWRPPTCACADRFPKVLITSRSLSIWSRGRRPAKAQQPLQRQARAARRGIRAAPVTEAFSVPGGDGLGSLRNSNCRRNDVAVWCAKHQGPAGRPLTPSPSMTKGNSICRWSARGRSHQNCSPSVAFNLSVPHYSTNDHNRDSGALM